MNNKGFTLVELLAVLIILIAIMGIAIPGISSSMQRTKSKQDAEKKKLLESYAEIYVADHKAAVYEKKMTNNKICICLSDLEGYLPDGALEDSDGNEIKGYILFTTTNNKYEFKDGSLPTTCSKGCIK